MNLLKPFLREGSARFLRIAGLSSGALLLSACAGMGAPPSCPDGSGMTCAGVNDIDHMVDTGRIRHDSGFDSSDASDSSDLSGASDVSAVGGDTETTSGDRVAGVLDTDDSGRAWLSDNHTGYAGNYSTPYGSQYDSGQPLRYGETVLHIWVAPYTDRADTYHQAAYLDAVVKKGYWIGHPPKV